MKDNGINKKLKVMAYILIRMELNMKVLGKMINSMEREKKFGMTELLLKVTIF